MKDQRKWQPTKRVEVTEAERKTEAATNEGSGKTPYVSKYSVRVLDNNSVSL